jgi:hypothetical protein
VISSALAELQEQNGFSENKLDGIVGGDDTLPLPMDKEDDDVSLKYRKKFLEMQRTPAGRKVAPLKLEGRIQRPEFGQTLYDYKEQSYVSRE